MGDLILSWFLGQDSHLRSFLEIIGMVARCYVNPRLVLGEVSTLKHCGVETHVSRKWEPLTPEEALFIMGRGDIIFIYPIF